MNKKTYQSIGLLVIVFNTQCVELFNTTFRGSMPSDTKKWARAILINHNIKNANELSLEMGSENALVRDRDDVIRLNDDDVDHIESLLQGCGSNISDDASFVRDMESRLLYLARLHHNGYLRKDELASKGFPAFGGIVGIVIGASVTDFDQNLAKKDETKALIGAVVGAAVGYGAYYMYKKSFKQDAEKYAAENVSSLDKIETTLKSAKSARLTSAQGRVSIKFE